MSSITKIALADSLKKLLHVKTLDKITVKDIVEDCGVNRQTFYYHFQDIPDLVEWICIDDVDHLIKKKEEYETWEDKFLIVFKIMLEEKIFVENIYHSVSREVLRTNLYRLVYPIIYDEITKKSKGKGLREEDKKFITNFYKYAFVSIVFEWIDKDMYENPEMIVLKVSHLVTGTIDHAVQSLKETDKSFKI